MSDPNMDKLKSYIDRERERQDRNRVCCENCCWFAATQDEPMGKCFRYPPVRVKGKWDYPEVSKRFLCGEFQNNRTGETMRSESQRHGMLRARVAELEDRIDRMSERHE